jgi:hypothetical protein
MILVDKEKECPTLGVAPLYDHIFFTSNIYTSLAERGLL